MAKKRKSAPGGWKKKLLMTWNVSRYAVPLLAAFAGGFAAHDPLVDAKNTALDAFNKTKQSLTVTFNAEKENEHTLEVEHLSQEQTKESKPDIIEETFVEEAPSQYKKKAEPKIAPKITAKKPPKKISKDFKKQQVKSEPDLLLPAVKKYLKKYRFTIPTEVNKAILLASIGHRDLYNVCILIAAAESSMGKNMSSKASTAEGLFHLINSTYLELAYKYKSGLPEELQKKYRLDKIGKYKTGKHKGKYYAPEKISAQIFKGKKDLFVNAYLTTKYILENLKHLKATLPDVKANGTYIYIKHFLGPNGGNQFIKIIEHGGYNDQAASGYDKLKSLVDANESLFFKIKGSLKPRISPLLGSKKAAEKFIKLAKNRGRRDHKPSRYFKVDAKKHKSIFFDESGVEKSIVDVYRAIRKEGWKEKKIGDVYKAIQRKVPAIPLTSLQSTEAIKNLDKQITKAAYKVKDEEKTPAIKPI